MISNWKSPNKKIQRLFITLVLMMMMMMMLLLFASSSSPSARLFVSLSKSGDGAKTSSSKSNGFVLCKDDDDVMAQDGCFRFRKGTLTDPWKKEREMQTMDPDDLIRNEQLVEKIREGEMKQRKPTSRDVEDMRRARDAFDAFDASEIQRFNTRDSTFLPWRAPRRCRRLATPWASPTRFSPCANAR